jgi:hypothetical protein
LTERSDERTAAIIIKRNRRMWFDLPQLTR